MPSSVVIQSPGRRFLRGCHRTSPPGPLSTSGEGEKEGFVAVRLASPPTPSPSDGEGEEERFGAGREASLPGPLSIGGRGGTEAASGHDPATIGWRGGGRFRDAQTAAISTRTPSRSVSTFSLRNLKILTPASSIWRCRMPSAHCAYRASWILPSNSTESRASAQ